MWVRVLKIVLTIAVSAFFLWLFFRTIDLHKLVESLRNVGAGWWLLALAALVQILHLVLRAIRWRILLDFQKKGIGFYNLLSTVSIGYTVSFLIGGRLGEVLRPIMLASREKISKSGSLATILLERLMDGLAVAFLLAVYFIFFTGAADGGDSGASEGMGSGWGVIVGVAVVLSFPFLWALVHFRDRAAAILRRIVSEEGRMGKAIHGIFQGVVDGFEVLRGGRALVAAWAYTFLIWLVIAFSIWFSLLAFSIRIPIEGSLLVMGALVLGIAVPTPGGVGTYEWFGQGVLVRFFGVDPSEAGAAVLVMHVFAISPVILMGLGFVWKEGLSLSGLTAEARAGKEGPGVHPRAERAAEGES
jgi:uncharacterized protein (TIRG00374 family)